MDKVQRLNKINKSLKAKKLNEIAPAIAAAVPTIMTGLRVAGGINLASKAVSSVSGEGNNQPEEQPQPEKKQGLLSKIASISTPGRMVANAPSIIPTNESIIPNFNFLKSISPAARLTDTSDKKTDTALKVAGHAATAMSVIPGLNLAGAATDAGVAAIRGMRAASATTPEEKEYEGKEAAASAVGAAAGIIPAGKVSVAAGKLASSAGKSAVRAGIPAVTVRTGIRAAEPVVKKGIAIGTNPELAKATARKFFGKEEIAEARKPGEPIITPPPTTKDIMVRDPSVPPPPPPLPPPPPRQQKTGYERAKDYIRGQWEGSGGSFGIYSKLKGVVKAGLRHVEKSPILRKLGITPFPSEAETTQGVKKTIGDVKQAGKVVGQNVGAAAKDVGGIGLKLAKRYPNLTKGLAVTVATGNPLKGLITYIGSKYMDSKGIDGAKIGKEMADRMADWIRTKTGVKTPSPTPPPPPPKPASTKSKDTGEIIDVEPVPPTSLPDDRPPPPKSKKKDVPGQEPFDWYKPKG